METVDMDKIETNEQSKFLYAGKSLSSNNLCNGGPGNTLLTREDLLRLDKIEPRWRHIRMWLLVLFWMGWLGLLAGSILTIIFTPRCPPVPALKYWQSGFGYWVDPFAFKDSGKDLVGDFKGLIEKLDYVKSTVGASFIVLGSFFSGYYTGTSQTLGNTMDFYDVDSALGSLSDFHSLIRTYHKNGLSVVATLNPNSISIYHPWVNNSSYLMQYDQKLVSRDGKAANVTINSRQYYTAFDDQRVDLDLMSENVTSELMRVTEFWLNKGVDGILLSDAAFYVEDSKAPFQEPQVKDELNPWFQKYPSSQLFINDSVQFVRRIREVIDKVSVQSSRPRLLAVEVGDCGYGLDNHTDAALQFLGTDDSPGAHLVVSRQFVKHRGWKAPPQDNTWEVSSIKSYDEVSSESKESLALTTATPSDQRTNDHIALASIFLLPGTPLVYYGTELGITPIGNNATFKGLYPDGKTSFPNLSERDSGVTLHIPMPWDRFGQGFSTAVSKEMFLNLLKQYNVDETVESATSTGRGETSFQLLQALKHLRRKPSLLWGKFEQLKTNPTDAGTQTEVFMRKAEGYPAFIVIIVRQKNFAGVFSMPAECENAITRLVYPSTSKLEIDKPIVGNSVYLQTTNHPAVYVFECPKQ